MKDCNRKDICYNYPKHCELCQATSDMVNCYPCFQDKDIVEVVRCKDCKMSDYCYPIKEKGKEAEEGCYCKRNSKYVKPNDFCSYGERKDS